MKSIYYANKLTQCCRFIWISIFIKYINVNGLLNKSTHVVNNKALNDI